MQIFEPVEPGMVGGDDDTEVEPSKSSLLHVDELSTRMCLHLLKNDQLRTLYCLRMMKFEKYTQMQCSEIYISRSSCCREVLQFLSAFKRGDFSNSRIYNNTLMFQCFGPKKDNLPLKFLKL